jgi:hypothetical protein
VNPNLKNKLLKIRQGNSTWQCTVRRAPVWITPKKQPAYRPFILLVLDQDADFILKTEILAEHPDAQTVLDHLFKTMQGTLLNLLKKQRPACISIDDAELVKFCAPQLAELDIRCELRASLPQVNAALFEMEAQANQREPIPGLLSIHGVSVPLAAELYAAAAEYHRQAPWRWIQNEMPIEVRFPQSTGGFPIDGPARYALVLGSGGEFFGLSLYESLADVRALTDLEVVLAPTDPNPPFLRSITWISLVLEEATAMSFADLDAIERYGWPVAGEKAYPLALKALPNDDFSQPPTASDIAWLAAALRVIPGFVSQQMRADRGLPRPAQASFPLPDVHGGQQISLRYPASAAQTVKSVAQAQDPELEAYIADWYGDEKSHKFARQVGRFLFEFLDSLDDSNLSEQTIRKHESLNAAMVITTASRPPYSWVARTSTSNSSAR